MTAQCLPIKSTWMRSRLVGHLPIGARNGVFGSCQGNTPATAGWGKGPCIGQRTTISSGISAMQRCRPRALARGETEPFSTTKQ